MDIELANSKGVISLKFSPANCTGYRASKISFSKDDISSMRNLARNDPAAFDTAMLQLEGRFGIGG